MSLYRILTYLQFIIFLALGIVFSMCIEKYLNKNKLRKEIKENGQAKDT